MFVVSQGLVATPRTERASISRSAFSRSKPFFRKMSVSVSHGTYCVRSSFSHWIADGRTRFWFREQKTLTSSDTLNLSTTAGSRRRRGSSGTGRGAAAGRRGRVAAPPRGATRIVRGVAATPRLSDARGRKRRHGPGARLRRGHDVDRPRRRVAAATRTFGRGAAPRPAPNVAKVSAGGSAAAAAWIVRGRLRGGCHRQGAAKVSPRGAAQPRLPRSADGPVEDGRLAVVRQLADRAGRRLDEQTAPAADLRPRVRRRGGQDHVSRRRRGRRADRLRTSHGRLEGSGFPPGSPTTSKCHVLDSSMPLMAPASA